MKDIKEMIAKYLTENELEETASKRGHVKLDPHIGKLVGTNNDNQKEVRKDFIFKNINSNLINCYLVNLIDETQLVSDKER